MAGYENLLKNWRLEPGEEDWSGTRVLRTKSGGAYSVPSIGDSFPQVEADELAGAITVPAGLTCRKISISTVHNSSIYVETHTATYSTKPLSGFDLEPEDEPDGLTFSLESEILESEGAKNGAKAAGVDPIKASTIKIYPTAQYNQTKVYSTLAAAISASSTEKLGTVLEIGSGTNDGEWAYVAMDANQYRNNEGVIKYRVVRKYQWKRISLTASTIGWNYAWDPRKGEYVLWTDAGGNYKWKLSGSFPDTMPSL